MNTVSISQLASVSDLQRNYNSLVKKVKKFAQPLFLLRRNQPEAVLMSITEYENLAKKRVLYEELEALKAIEEFETDRKAGKLLIGKSGQDLFKFK